MQNVPLLTRYQSSGSSSGSHPVRPIFSPLPRATTMPRQGCWHVTSVLCYTVETTLDETTFTSHGKRKADASSVSPSWFCWFKRLPQCLLYLHWQDYILVTGKGYKLVSVP
jgi:hypothetical protein